MKSLEFFKAFFLFLNLKDFLKHFVKALVPYAESNLLSQKGRG